MQNEVKSFSDPCDKEVSGRAPHCANCGQMEIGCNESYPGENVKMGKEGNTLESRMYKDCIVCFVWINMKKEDVPILEKNFESNYSQRKIWG